MTLREYVHEKVQGVIPRKLTGKEIALSGVMAAVMAIAAFIPVTVVAGVGKVISAAVILEPLIGVILGPVLGTYAAAAGAFAGQIIAPQGNIFHYLTFIPPTVGAATAGLLAHRRWKAASGIMAGVVLLWYTTSIGRQLYYYPYMPILFLGFALLFRNNLGEWIHVKYNDVIGFRGAGIQIMITGLLLMVCAQVVFFGYTREFFAAGILFAALVAVFLFTYLIKGNDLLKIVSALVFIAAGILSFAFLRVGGMGVVPMFQYSQTDQVSLLQTVSCVLIIAGIVLILLMHFQNIQLLKKYSGIALFAAGFLGVIEQVLLLSSNSQVIRREFLQLGESIPFFTSVSGKELEIASVLDYYTKKVFVVYVGHIGWFLIFVALIVLGISFLLNVSVEKLSVAYFIIAGCAVLSDLMIGNYLAIHVLNLNAGIFKAFLFIYPVERMFMAFFATIFGVGVIVPLKKFGVINMIRR